MEKLLKYAGALSLWSLVLGLVLSGGVWARSGCLRCHAGLEEIMPPGSKMMQAIKNMGQMYGDPEGCVVCHGGNPKAKTKELAHRGVPPALKKAPGPKDFYPDPGSIWIVENTCGVCHPGYVYRLERSLMQTEAGKIAGNLHTWGFKEAQNYKVPYGNYGIKDTDGLEPMIGTEEYKKYMEGKIRKYPFAWPKELKPLPKVNVKEILKDPKKAAFTYLRQECQRCHVGVRGREKRGDYRGMGCSACHILYSNEGYYEGNDPTIPKDEPGHMLKHRIVGTRETGGIPVETCNSCHNRGKRIGVSYQGLMEFPYGSPWTEKGMKQPQLHTKYYMFISDDVHHRKGLLCQDCHTSLEMHGDGNIPGTTLAQVEIECTDCHGTPDKYPWELPLGYGDEPREELSSKPRGVKYKCLPLEEQFGYPYAPGDGFLLSARGNPLGNVVRRGNQVILHSATGKDFRVPLLKNLARNHQWQNLSAEVAMVAVKKHMDKMECYSCHASWAPQCYGCHVRVSYKVDKKTGLMPMGTDWVANGRAKTKNGLTPDWPLGKSGLKTPGKVTELRSYLRWEEPILGINGEGLVSPLMPGCQVVYTVIGPDGKTLVHNKIAMAPDEARTLGQKHIPLAIDMAPVQPHTIQAKARSCESCHTNPKTVGLGIGGGALGMWPKDIVEDLIDARSGKVIPKRYQVQISGIPQLTFDWSQIVTRNGVQLVTVGSHWPLSRAFNKQELDTIVRAGSCMGCHQKMADPKFWKKISTPGALDPEQHLKMMYRMLEIVGQQGIKPAQGIPKTSSDKMDH